MLFSGEALDGVFSNQVNYVRSLRLRHQSLQATFADVWRRFVERIHIKCVSEGDGGETNFGDKHEFLLSVGNQWYLFNYYLAEGILEFLREDLKKACYFLQKASENSAGAVGMMLNAQLNFYFSLALIRKAWNKKPDKKSSKYAKLVETVTANQRVMQNFAKHAPANYLQKV